MTTDDSSALGETRPLFSRNDLWLGFGIFLVGALVRGLYLADIASLPLFQTPIVDAQAYDAWAVRIAGGDWWGDRVFYQAPAYPYFLGLIYAIGGHDLWLAHAVQMLMGAASCLLLAVATRLLFGSAAGAVAGLGLALYAPAIFFDGLIQKAGLGLFFTTSLLALLALYQRRPRPALAVAAGGVLGLLVLTRENAAIFAPVIGGWMLLYFRRQPSSARALRLAGFALGLTAVLFPVGLRNYAVGDTFALTTSQLGTNFYIGNNSRATGIYQPLLPGRQTPEFEGLDARRLAERAEGRPLSAGEVSRHWLVRALTFIAERPAAWASLLFVKALLVVNAFEIPDAESFDFYTNASPLLGALGRVGHFGVLLPLAVAGMLLAWPMRREAWLLYALAVGFAASVTAFYVFARYRYPLVPLLLPFAALAVVRAATLLRAKRWRSLWVPGLAALAAAAVANLELVDERPYLAGTYNNLAAIMLRSDRLDEAEPYLQTAARLAPDDPDVLFQLGVLRFEQGRHGEAEQQLRRMLELAPRDFRGHRVLAAVLRRAGRAEEARVHAHAARRLDPDRARPPSRPPGPGARVPGRTSRPADSRSEAR